MTPIESEYDARLVTLIGVAIESIQDLSLRTNQDVDKILAERLYTVNKHVHEVGGESYLKSLNRSYPLLREAIS